MSRRALLHYVRHNFPVRCAAPHRFIAVAVAGLISFVPSGGADTYSAWKARVFTDAEQADSAISGQNALSPAHDGIPNLLKYAFALDPHQNGAFALPRIGFVQVANSSTGGLSRYPTITYQASASNPPSDLYYVPEVSFDLRNWVRGDSVFDSPSSQSGANPGDPTLITCRALLAVTSGSKAFLRLRVLEGQTLPDDWQLTNFGHTGVDPNGDADLDSRTNFEEFLHGTDPNDYYEGRTPMLTIVSGDRQRGFASQLLPFPLVVRVTYNGASMANAPVQFSVSQGDARVSSELNLVPQNIADVRTDQNGNAAVYVFLGSTPNLASVIQASANAQARSFVETSLAPRSARVVAGEYHSLELDGDGSVWTWGDNSYGQLGDGTYNSRSEPLLNAGLGAVMDVSGGPEHNAAAESDGTVWAWGPNWAGQLGDGTHEDRLVPTQVPSLNGVIGVSVGEFHTIAVKADGTVWAWGYNGDGELGNGTTSDSASPVQVVTESGAPLQDVVAVAAGYYHNLALKADGSLWVWGANWFGALGDGTNNDRHYAVQLAGLSNVKAIAAGAYHSLAVQNAGQPAIKSPRSAQVGATAQASSGAIWSWGANFSGQLGDGTFDQRDVPGIVPSVDDIVQVTGGYGHNLVLKSDGTVWGWGDDSRGQVGQDPDSDAIVPGPVVGLTNIVSVAAGGSHSLALSSNGLIYAWGSNGDGQLGISEEITESGPTPALKSSNYSGMPDMWQLQWFGRIGVAPNADEDGDGLTNVEEYKLGTFPNNAYSDGDSVPDGEDGWPLDGDLHPPRLPEYSYAVVDLGEGAARAINNHNVIIGDNGSGFIWENGVRQDLPDRGDRAFAVGINDSGVAVFNFDGAMPAIWSAGSYTDIGINADSEHRIFGWDPNIVWQYAGPHGVNGINNAGIVIGNVRATWSWENFSPFWKVWPLSWTSSYSVPDLIFARPDANDRILDVDDSQPRGFFKNYDQTADSFNFAGHFDNRRGLDNDGGISGINNAGQMVGTVLHHYGLKFGFPDVANVNGVEPPRFNEVTFWNNGEPERVAEGTYKYASSLNDDGVIVGTDVIVTPGYHYVYTQYTKLWIKVDGQWKEKDLGVDGFDEARRINRNIQIISGSVLYQNGHAVDLYTRIPDGYTTLQMMAINEKGYMVGQADVDSGNGTMRTHAVLLVPADLLTDFNRDGKIDEHDRGKITADNPHRFWINDDLDYDETGGDDIPGSSVLPDYSDDIVNGVRDLVDFFPLFLDLKGLIGALPSGQDFVYKLKQADEALNFFETGLSPATSGTSVTDVATARAIGNGTVQRISADGVALSEQFISSISNGTGGIILLEGRAESDAPLVFEIDDSQGRKLAELKLQLRIRGVEQMYRHFNMMSADNAFGGRLTEMREPANYPDNLCSDKTFVFVHGFFVSADGARGWDAEIFKRMYWAGSKAKFVGTTWHADEKNGTTLPDYHKNVDNAFATAFSFAALVKYLGPNVTVAAHSLGNVVVGSAIQDWGATPANYFMVDAAVPMEAYDGGTATDDAMIHPDWIPYRSPASAGHPVADRLFASEWYLDPTFLQGDARKTLTWRDRLGNVGTNTYNFYSSSEEVLRRHEGDPGFFTDTLWTQILHAGLYTWSLQEKLKGHQIEHNVLGIVDAKVGSTYGGWQLTANFYNPPEQPHTPTPSEAAASSDESLLIAPIFDPGFLLQFSTPNEGGVTKFIHNDAPPWIIDLTDSARGSATAQAHRNQLLAEMFPARTLPAGANLVTGFGNTANFNMPVLYKNGWPQERGSDTDWRHSDFKAVAYTYIYPLFKKFSTVAGLAQ